jgi:tRNA nucleotidyltransferase (CCA-adding enzyme)
MDAGQVKVYPQDSVEDLQRLMTDSGWGQIPVMDPETGEVIGIVTRTDLLKTLTSQPPFPTPRNLANRLEATLPPARLRLLKSVAQAAYQQRAALYIVGGFVRDMLLERPSLDFDLVVEGDAIHLAQTLAKKYGGRVTSHARFGTSKWHIGDHWKEVLENLQSDKSISIEIEVAENNSSVSKQEILPEALDLISARTEFYTYPTALPTVERGSIKLDLHRRDFTINTLALRLDGHHYAELYDYWGGLNDLNDGLVRVLHSLSFVDDPTRMLRAVRFEQRFNFQIGTRTLDLLKGAIPLLDRVSGDRIRHELDHIFAEPLADRMFSRLDELQLLEAIESHLTWDDWLSKCMRSLEEIPLEPEWRLDGNQGELRARLGYILWLLRLPANDTRKVIKRLKISRKLADEIYSAQELWRDIPALKAMKPSEMVARLDDVEPLAIYANYIAADDQKLRQLIQSYVFKWSQIFPNTDGHILQEMGIPPGPIYRQILQTLRNAWLDGTIDSPEEEAVLLDELIQNSKT